MEMIKCNICGAIVNDGKFCSNCGTLLHPINKESTAYSAVSNDISLKDNAEINSSISSHPDNTSVSDEGLTMLCEYCRKTLATVGGDGYTEDVLYRRGDDEYEIHYYSKYEYMPYEVHYAYKAPKNLWDEINTYIHTCGVTEYVGKSGIGLCGGEYLIKYREGDKLIRISTSNIKYEDVDMLHEVGRMLAEAKKKENKI